MLKIELLNESPFSRRLFFAIRPPCHPRIKTKQEQIPCRQAGLASLGMTGVWQTVKRADDTRWDGIAKGLWRVGEVSRRYCQLVTGVK